MVQNSSALILFSKGAFLFILAALIGIKPEDRLSPFASIFEQTAQRPSENVKAYRRFGAFRIFESTNKASSVGETTRGDTAFVTGHALRRGPASHNLPIELRRLRFRFPEGSLSWKRFQRETARGKARLFWRNGIGYPRV